MTLPLPPIDFNALFRDPRMFDSKETFIRAGFKVRKPSPHNIMVGSHPSAANYLFKKYSRDVPLDEQLENYDGRLKGADKIRQVIHDRQLRHIVVPHKWVYQLPPGFADRHKQSHVLIVQWIDILDVAETEKRYRHIDKVVLEELCHVLFNFRGFDSAMHNLRFTSSGQIAFIDTESWNRKERPDIGVFRRINEALTSRSRKRVKRMFEKLEEEAT